MQGCAVKLRKKTKRIWRRIGDLGKRKGGLIEGHMVSNNNLIGCHIKATIVLVLCWITNEDTNSRMGSELVSGRVGEVQITLAPKNMQIREVRMNAIKDEVRSGERKCFRGAQV
jgi:hypothetical protein